MITGVHHVGIAVQSLDRAYAFWRDGLGLPLIVASEVADQGIRAALLACEPAEIELLEPTGEESGVTRFLARRGEGLHHLCLQSDEVGRDVRRLVGAGVHMIDRKPRPGLAGAIAFVHPRSSAGVLIELATPDSRSERETRTPGALAAPSQPPLAMTAVHATVEHVGQTAQLYKDLFGLSGGPLDPSASLAQLAVGEVILQFASGKVTASAPGLSAVRLSAKDLEAFAVRLSSQGVASRRWSGGLSLGPTGTSGVPLIIEARQPNPNVGGRA